MAQQLLRGPSRLRWLACGAHRINIDDLPGKGIRRSHIARESYHMDVKLQKRYTESSLRNLRPRKARQTHIFLKSGERKGSFLPATVGTFT